ncbi:hypothetical protein JB92DRAFT_3127501 [Gautieria morchelliformis]|nr:hypothetical protein JB92DRAFT_3127501 [Gautieria morchelliformis]
MSSLSETSDSPSSLLAFLAAFLISYAVDVCEGCWVISSVGVKDVVLEGMTTIRSPTPAPDLGDPVAILNTRGISESNKTDISALATALESFGDFKCGTSRNLGKEGATQLVAIAKLLREASHLYGNNRVATNADLQQAVSDIKEAVTFAHGQP